MGLVGGENTYLYVDGNPARYIDPYGFCKNTSGLSQACLSALVAANADREGLTRAENNWAVIQVAAEANGIPPDLLAAIALRESDFRNIPQSGGGLGEGIFQIDLGENPSVTPAQALNISYSANFAAHVLATNMTVLATEFPDFSPLQLLQATAASYNFGTGNISGNPSTIDVGTTGNNYGSSVLNLMMNCLLKGGS